MSFKKMLKVANLIGTDVVAIFSIYFLENTTILNAF